MTGPTRAEVLAVPDLSVRETGAVAPLLLAMVLLGFFPQPMLDVINPATEATLERVGAVDDEPTVPPGSVESQAGAETEGGQE
jgi:NADH-quinone oxidoreductase subunit M